MQGLARFLVVLLIVTFSPVVLPDQNEDLAAFKLAYLQYEEFSKQGDLKKSLPQARLAYELGPNKMVIDAICTYCEILQKSRGI